MNKPLLAATLVLGLMAPGGGPHASEAGRMPRVFAKEIRPGVTRADFLAAVIAPYRAANSEVDEMIARFDATHPVSYRETVRAEGLAQYVRYDIDGDGRITAEEVATAVRRVREAHSAPVVEPGFGLVVAEIMKADLDGDGFIDREEIFRRAGVITEDMFKTDLSGYLELTPVGASISDTRILALAERAFSGVDTDGDGIVSAVEMASLKGEP